MENIKSLENTAVGEEDDFSRTEKIASEQVTRWEVTHPLEPLQKRALIGVSLFLLAIILGLLMIGFSQMMAAQNN